MSASKITSDVNTHPGTFFQLVTIQMSISLTHHRKTVVVSFIMMESFLVTHICNFYEGGQNTYQNKRHSLQTISLKAFPPNVKIQIYPRLIG